MIFIWRDRRIVTLRDLLDAVERLVEDAEARQFLRAYRAVQPDARANLEFLRGFARQPEARRRLAWMIDESLTSAGS